MRYVPFCADFGPYNLGMMHHFNATLKRFLCSSKLAGTKIVYFTTTRRKDITNAVFLMGAFLVAELGARPEQAFAPFGNVASVLLPYRDATWVKSSFDITVMHCWQALHKAIRHKLYDPETFDENEYFYYDHPQNGDMHQVVKGKFFAFRGPTDKKIRNYYKRPKDYLEIFRALGMKAIVRLNNAEYDRQTFVKAGFQHHDLFFEDCTTPSNQQVDSFLRLAETTDGPLAVHCLAGLGRTGTLIGLYMMKHFGFCAEECIAWLRLVRPGSVIGPQQQYLKDQEARMLALGKWQPSVASCRATSSLITSSDHDASKLLAGQITDGLQKRDSAREIPRLQLPKKTASFSEGRPHTMASSNDQAGDSLPTVQLRGSFRPSGVAVASRTGPSNRHTMVMDMPSAVTCRPGRLSVLQPDSSTAFELQDRDQLRELFLKSRANSTSFSAATRGRDSSSSTGRRNGRRGRKESRGAGARDSHWSDWVYNSFRLPTVRASRTESLYHAPAPTKQR